ncbi:alanine racemase [Rubellimicrobium sp. CFH 75288]|uniref:alanine racemase n=1 Tax=Rubellimicrobium sp. CFH 75288 TaxID=2697034 RepID=UPI001411D2E8|nr:alanine racemase [Rubellimicrobium sp. CFH 75288]NAZ35981.1 alanine racemase [Rubellimicrobium sp. CFH 75288]
MGTGRLRVDLDAVVANWRALSALARVECGAVVKADAYGLGAGPVARALATAGCRTFFVAVAEEGAALRRVLGEGPEILVFSGHMAGDAPLLEGAGLVPLVNSLDQLMRQIEALPGHPFGIQIDTGMNRLGMELSEWAAVAEIALEQNPVLLMSHLACADEPDHPMNPYQLDLFRQMTDGIGVRRSLAATGGILLGPDYVFDLCRPGIGLYGGLPFEHAHPVVTLDLPVIQVRDLAPGEVAGYGNAWQAERPSRLATLSAGYADGIFRALSHNLVLWHGDTPCPAVGRISMDLVIADVTDLPEEPDSLTLIGPRQTIDQLAAGAGTIGYEVLTALGARLARSHVGASA